MMQLKKYPKSEKHRTLLDLSCDISQKWRQSKFQEQKVNAPTSKSKSALTQFFLSRDNTTITFELPSLASAAPSHVFVFVYYNLKYDFAVK